MPSVASVFLRGAGLHDHKQAVRMGSSQAASRQYIIEQAKRHDTAVAAAFRRALGVQLEAKLSNRHRKRRRVKATDKELEACRKQTHGVVWKG